MQSKHPSRPNKVKRAVAALAVLGIAGTAGILWSSNELHAKTPPVPSAVSSAPAAILAPINIADVVQRVSPAVVSVKVTAEEPHSQQFSAPPGLEEFFQRFFGQQFGPGFQQNQPGAMPHGGGNGGGDGGPRVIQGIGSGFIIDPEGHIVTNNHVVGGANGIVVVMNDGKKYPAKLIGRDTKTDLAVIKIDAGKKLPFVKFGRSQDMRVGDWVITMGSPFGLGHTATTGIVSARHRDIGSGPYDDYLQIDAAINPGNSGGPAFNLAGDVIGVNTAIYTPNGGNIGIGFAIPSSLAKDVVAQLKTGKSITRGWLGVAIQNVTDDIADGVGLDSAKGALVTKVNGGGPADKAGVKQGDVILSVNGNNVKELRDLPRMIAALQPGSSAKLTVWRAQKEKNLEVTLGTMPKEDQVASAETTQEVGLALESVSQEQLQQHGIDSDHGVLVANVKPNSVAARAGFRRGDVIVEVGGKDVSDPNDVISAVRAHRKAKDKAVLVLVDRGKMQRFVALPLRAS